MYFSLVYNKFLDNLKLFFSLCILQGAVKSGFDEFNHFTMKAFWLINWQYKKQLFNDTIPSIQLVNLFS